MTATLDPLTALQQPVEAECARKGCTRRAWRWGKTYCQPHARALGLVHHRIPAEPIRTHVQNCIDAGATSQGIATATGASLTSIRKLVRGISTTLRHATAEKLWTATPDMTGMVPILGTRRRLRAWRAAGWTTQEIQDATGIPEWTVHEIVSDQCRISTVSRTRHQTVAAAFTTETQQVRRPADPRITRKRWPMPADWDNPDDPHETPKTNEHADTARKLVALHGTYAAAGEACGWNAKKMHRITTGAHRPNPTDINTIRTALTHGAAA